MYLSLTSYLINLSTHGIFRWNIAIKTSSLTKQNIRTNDRYSQSANSLNDEIASLMDEARTMLKVGQYHENIVNLQGITIVPNEALIRQVNISYMLSLSENSNIIIV